MALTHEPLIAIAALQNEVSRLRHIVRDTRTHLNVIRAAGVIETDRLCCIAGFGPWSDLIDRLKELPTDRPSRGKETTNG